jgi:hypothetical protein
MEEPKYVIRQENGDIILKPCELVNTIAPTGINITPVTLSRMGTTKRWFFDFLNGTENNPDECAIEGKTYQTFRNSGNVYLKETRGNTANIVGFTLGEIQKVIEEFQQE